MTSLKIKNIIISDTSFNKTRDIIIESEHYPNVHIGDIFTFSFAAIRLNTLMNDGKLKTDELTRWFSSYESLYNRYVQKAEQLGVKIENVVFHNFDLLCKYSLVSGTGAFFILAVVYKGNLRKKLKERKNQKIFYYDFLTAGRTMRKSLPSPGSLFTSARA